MAPAWATQAIAGDESEDPVWSDQLTGESYYGHTISIGNHGTQVFTDSGKTNQRVRLYSSFNEAAAPVWEQPYTHTALNRVVDSSEEGDVHAVWRQDLPPGSGIMVAKAYLYRSSNQAPFAVYTFPETDYGSGNGFCSVSDDGRWVVAATGILSDVRIARFDTESSSPQSPESEALIDHFGSVTDFGTSTDGSRLYMGGQLQGMVYDLNSGAMLFEKTYTGGAEPRGHAFSGDGRTIVVPQAKMTKIYRQNGGTFELLTQFDPFPSTANELPWAGAISHDGDIVVAAYTVLPAFQDAHIFAWRVSTGEQLLHHVQYGSGTDDNLPNTIEISRNGDRFVVGSYGDEGGLTPELQIFELNQQGTAFSRTEYSHRPGSVFDMDLSADGNYLAVSGRTSHANATTGSKVIEVFDLGSDLRARGMPRDNNTLEIEFFPQGQTFLGYLLVSEELATTTLPFGTLFLQRQSAFSMIPMGQANGQGTLEGSFPISGAVGKTWYLQGYATGPRQLSKNWLPVTVPP